MTKIIDLRESKNNEAWKTTCYKCKTTYIWNGCIGVRCNKNKCGGVWCTANGER